MARRLRELLQVGFIASFFHERDGISLVGDSDITLNVRPRDSLSWSSNSIGIGIVDFESFKALGILRYPSQGNRSSMGRSPAMQVIYSGPICRRNIAFQQ